MNIGNLKCFVYMYTNIGHFLSYCNINVKTQIIDCW